jgi:hypothetical protein
MRHALGVFLLGPVDDAILIFITGKVITRIGDAGPLAIHNLTEVGTLAGIGGAGIGDTLSLDAFLSLSALHIEAGLVTLTLGTDFSFGAFVGGAGIFFALEINTNFPVGTAQGLAGIIHATSALGITFFVFPAGDALAFFHALAVFAAFRFCAL